ncbi:5586_t:CDS:10 [Diversispora eburnea]|uniref:Chloride channel protein n=1 Tax=Diversispora eburnea TaxID=1213867 RepID=A0A9N8YTL8_9GLOM|nr:5586_t:CDS:10 [Diversispora eburnea]
MLTELTKVIEWTHKGKDIKELRKGDEIDSPTETTNLLNGEPSKNYTLSDNNNNNYNNNDIIGSSNSSNTTTSNRRHTWNPSQLRVITKPLRYKRRSGVYDEDKQALVQEGSGIHWIHDYVKERVRVRKLYSLKGFRGYLKTTCDSAQGWILVFLIGIVTAFFAAVVDVAAEWGSELKEGYCKENIQLKKEFCCKDVSEKNCTSWVEWSEAFNFQGDEESLWWFEYIAYVFVAFCFAVGAVVIVKYNSLYATPSTKSSTKSRIFPTKKRLIPYAAGSGIPEVKCILSGFVIRGFLGLRTLWVKAVTLAMVVSAGLTLGKEGPFVHIACCVGNIFTRLSPKYNKNEGKRREILSASAAAGVSVAFAAPIGGVLFSLEEVSYYFPSKTMVRSFFCAIVAAVTLKLLDPFGTGKTVLFQVTYDKDWHLFEIDLVYFLFSECSQESKSSELAGLCVTKPEEVKPIIYLLLVALISKFLTCIITFGIRTPAGIFIPSLLIGACIGRMLGLAVQWLTWTYPYSSFFTPLCDPHETNNCIIPGVYAMVGAASVLAGVTRMTPIMTAIMISKWVADGLVKHGIYDLLVDLNEHPYLDSNAEYVTTKSTLEICQTNLEVIDVNEANTIGELKEKLERLGYSDAGFPIVDDSTLVGYIASTELEHALQTVAKCPDSTRCYFKEFSTPEIIMSDGDSNPKGTNFVHYMDKAPLTVAQNSSLELVLELFKKLGLKYVCVVNCGHYVGVIHKKKLLAELKEMR